ncbi:TPA: tail protein (tape measure) [Escherichia coli]|nr:tail protein (tape measure) [Escherichia coli]
MTEQVGGVEIQIDADVQPMLDGAKEVVAALKMMEGTIQGTGKSLDSLDQNTLQTGKSIDTMATYSRSMDSSLKTLNTSVTAIAKAMLEAKNNTNGAGYEFSRAEAIIEGLGNQLAILDEAQDNGARSAAILAAQLRAGSKASDEEKQKIGELTGRLFDMKTASDTGSKGHGNWKTSMQQAGYQVQDFIIQVQGGQSALVAFAQQGSQLAGAFGPSGAVIGAVIALGSVIAGTLITSLNGGKSAMDALKDAAESMDKVITISNQGVAALSDKYAALARTNANVATILRNQALLEYNQAIAKIPKAISDASDSFITLGDRAIAAFGGSSPSIKKFNEELTRLGATSTDWYQAIQQANSQGQYAVGVVSSLSATVSTLSSRMGISKQAAFELAKQLSDLSNNPSPEALEELIKSLQGMTSSSKDGKGAIAGLTGSLKDLWVAALNAKQGVDSVAKATDNLTAGQKNLIQQSERTLALSKLQGEARARLQARYAAEDAGFAKDDPHALKMEQDAVATYRNTQAQKTLQSEQKKGESQAGRNAKVLEEYRQKAALSADSTANLSREQAILAARQKLTNPSPQQIAQVERDAALAWDKATALKAQAAAEKLLPEARENASYKQDVADLNTALAAKKISQQQYNETSEHLEAAHQTNLAKIRAQQAVTPQQEAAGSVDPVQQLANENARKLALIQQYEQQGVLTHQNALALRAAADTEYEQARTAAQWEIYRNQSLGNELLAASLEGLQSGATNALTGLIDGTQSLQEAMANVGSTIINSVISSLVEMGMQWVKNQVIAQAANSTAAASAASTGASITASMAPAAAATNIATMGTASTVGLTAMSAAIPAMIGLFGGARENGGPVSANSMYRVGEGDKPEIFKASNGSQYMIPGDNGRVISNRDIGSGGGGGAFHFSPTIQVNGDPSAQQLAMLEMAVKRGAQQGYNMAVNDIASGKGKLSNALSTSFNTSQRLT